MKRLKDINWNQVYYFYEVSKKLSMKNAAAFLQVSQPTVSDQIKRLEERLGVSLFRREVRRIALTPEGQSLFLCTKDIFEAGFRFLDIISPDAIGGYPVRVGLQETISLTVSINFVERYWDLFAPFGTVNTVRESFFERITEKLLKNESDWAIVLEQPKSARIAFQEIGSFEILFCCSPQIYRRFRRKEDILRALPLIRSGWDHALNAAIDDHLRNHDALPEELIESDHREFCLGLAQRGRCVAVFAAETIKAAPWASSVQAFRIGEPIILRLYAAWNKANQKMIAIRKLLELMATPTGQPELNDPELQLRLSEVPKEWLIEDPRGK